MCVLLQVLPYLFFAALDARQGIGVLRVLPFWNLRSEVSLKPANRDRV